MSRSKGQKRAQFKESLVTMVTRNHANNPWYHINPDVFGYLMVLSMIKSCMLNQEGYDLEVDKVIFGNPSRTEEVKVFEII